MRCDNTYALGIHRSQRPKPVIDVALQPRALRLDAVRPVVAVDGALHRNFGIHVEQYSAIGHQASRRGGVQLLDNVWAQLAPVALVGHRRIGEAIAHHDLALFERRHNHLAHELSARGLIEQKLGHRVHALQLFVQQKSAHALAYLGATGLVDLYDLVALFSQMRGQTGGLRSLSRTVRSLECDEQPLLHGLSPSHRIWSARRRRDGRNARALHTAARENAAAAYIICSVF